MGASDHIDMDRSSSRERERSRPRTFQSRESVWATFESMAHELHVSVDELVNDAMAAYARVRGYSVPATTSQDDERDPLEETRDAPGTSGLDPYAPRGGGGFDDDLARTAARGTFTRPSHPAGRSSAPPSYASESLTAPRMKQPLPAALRRPVPLAPLAPPPSRPSSPAVPPARPSGGLPPPPLPSRPAMQSRESSIPSPSSAKRLVLAYQGRQYPVDKDRFLIGRSKTQSDLRLDDPNVSRQHAAIERVGAAWYVVDLGSTNGVHVAGERVARRALTDGDVIVITSHEIRCVLR